MINRREFLNVAGALCLTHAQPLAANETRQLPTRPIPGKAESLAIIGLGSSRVFRAGDEAGARRLLDIFTSHGGHYVDVGGKSATVVGQLSASMGTTDQLFLGTYIDPGETSAMRNSARSLAQAQEKNALDLIHTRDLGSYRNQNASYRALQEEGLVRLIGVARTGNAAQGEMLRLIEDGMVDFIQVNYSLLEREAGERLLPLARDKGIGVLISRPFINGDYFRIVDGQELPEWATEFDCESWAQFSLKFILSNPAVTCVLTETSNPDHALDNIGGGFGRLPDAAMQQRMIEHILGLS